MSKILGFPTEEQQRKKYIESLFDPLKRLLEDDETWFCIKDALTPIFDELVQRATGKLPKPIVFPTYIPKKDVIPLKKNIQESYGLFYSRLLLEVFVEMMKLQMRICVLEQKEGKAR
jgi:hypothetical protein